MLSEYHILSIYISRVLHVYKGDACDLCLCISADWASKLPDASPQVTKAVSSTSSVSS